MSVRIVPGKGFQLTFENGRTLSVMFGYGNYCENRHNIALRAFEDYGTPLKTSHIGKTFEVAGWNSAEDGGEWVSLGCDTVDGWLDLKQVVAYGRWLRDSTPEDLEFEIPDRRSEEGCGVCLSTTLDEGYIAVKCPHTSLFLPLFTSVDSGESALNALALAYVELA